MAYIPLSNYEYDSGPHQIQSGPVSEGYIVLSSGILDVGADLGVVTPGPATSGVYSTTAWREVPPAISGYWTDFEENHYDPSGVLSVYNGYRPLSVTTIANAKVQTSLGPEFGVRDAGKYTYFGGAAPDNQNYTPYNTPAGPSFDPEPGLPGGSSPSGGGPGGGPGLNRLPAMGSQYPGGTFGNYAPSAVAGTTGYGPFYQQPVQPVSVSLLPVESVGSSAGEPGPYRVPALPVPQPGSTVSATPTDGGGYSTTQSAFTGPTVGLPSPYGSADLVQQRLYDPNFLSDFYGAANAKPKSRNNRRR